MDKQYLKTHLNRACLSNIDLIDGEIKGIALYFTGLGHASVPTTDMVAAPFCAEKGILYILPFYNPWCWMNKRTVNYVDAIVDCAKELYNLDANIPVGIYGGSMGGYNTFHYALKSKHRIVAADLLCPCCNTEYEMSVNPGLLFRSYFDSAMEDTDDFGTYIKENSPVSMVEKLPKIPYRFAVGLRDTVLAPGAHSLLMIERMTEAGHSVERMDYPEMAHCNISSKQRIEEHRWLCEKIIEAK